MNHRIGVIDIGTNSIKCIIADIDAGSFHVIQESKRSSRLGDGLLQSGIISPAAFARNLQAIRELHAMCVEAACTKVIVVGTMGLRTATNADEFINAVYHEIKCHIRVLSGLEEAEYSYLGSSSSFTHALKKATFFDIGGGSSEFIFTTDGQIERSFSIDIGILRVRDEFCKSDPITAADYHRMHNSIFNTLKQYITGSSPESLIGIGGTVNTLSSVERQLRIYDADKIHGTSLSIASLERQIQLYRETDNAGRKQIPGMPWDRSDVILAGATIVLVILELCGVDEFTISTRGVRHGILQEYCNGFIK